MNPVPHVPTPSPEPRRDADRTFWQDLQSLIQMRLQWHQHFRNVSWSEEACQQCEAIDQEIERIREVHWSRNLAIEVIRGLEQVNPTVWILLFLMLVATLYSLFD